MIVEIDKNAGRQIWEPKKIKIYGSRKVDISDKELMKGSAYLPLYNINYQYMHI